MRILGLDYGERRIGVALSDETGVAARGLTTLIRKNRQKDLQAFVSMIETYRIERIVIGYPLRIDGTEGIQCEKVKRFSKWLGKIFPGPIVCWDETFSTKDAQDIMAQTHVKRHKRKEVVDRIAAAIILQDYLDRRPKDDAITPEEES